MINQKSLAQLFVWFLIVSFSTLNSGCTSGSSLPLKTHLDIYSKKIALVPSSRTIERELDLYANSRIEGAMKGAGAGVVATLGTFGGGSCEGAFCGVVVLVQLAAAVVGGTVGGIYGLATSPSGKSVERMEETLIGKPAGQLSQLTFAELMQQRVSQNKGLNIETVQLKAGGAELSTEDYEMFKMQGFEELFYLDLTNVDFLGGKGEDPELTLSLSAEAKIIDLNHPEKTVSKAFDYSGRRALYSNWTTMSSEELQSHFDLSLNALVENIYYELFEAVDLNISSGYFDFPGTGKYGCCWICPEDPPLKMVLWKGKLGYPLVDSRRPTLKWSSFPDKSQEKDLLEKAGETVENIRYDLKVWQGYGSIVYQSKDIPVNYHTLEEELAANSDYYWSIRACFDIKQKKVCTRWANSTYPYRDSNPFKDYCQRTETLIDNFYRFKTPDL